MGHGFTDPHDPEPIVAILQTYHVIFPSDPFINPPTLHGHLPPTPHQIPPLTQAPSCSRRTWPRIRLLPSNITIKIFVVSPPSPQQDIIMCSQNKQSLALCGHGTCAIVGFCIRKYDRSATQPAPTCEKKTEEPKIVCEEAQHSASAKQAQSNPVPNQATPKSSVEQNLPVEMSECIMDSFSVIKSISSVEVEVLKDCLVRNIHINL